MNLRIAPLLALLLIAACESPPTMPAPGVQAISSALTVDSLTTVRFRIHYNVDWDPILASGAAYASLYPHVLRSVQGADRMQCPALWVRLYHDVDGGSTYEYQGTSTLSGATTRQIQSQSHPPWAFATTDCTYDFKKDVYTGADLRVEHGSNLYYVGLLCPGEIGGNFIGEFYTYNASPGFFIADLGTIPGPLGAKGLWRQLAGASCVGGAGDSGWQGTVNLHLDWQVGNNCNPFHTQCVPGPAQMDASW